MHAALVREARRRANITQTELARRMETHQPVIARWESGRTSPDFQTVANLVKACGFHMSIGIYPINQHDETLIIRELAMRPHERLSSMVSATNAFEAMSVAANG